MQSILLPLLVRKNKSTGKLCMQPEMQECGKQTMKLIEKGGKLSYVYKRVRTGHWYLREKCTKSASSLYKAFLSLRYKIMIILKGL